MTSPGRTLLVGLVVAALLVAAGAKPVSRPSADDWDRRIRRLAAEASRLRELDFEHPVPVRFLSDAAFERQVTADRGDLSLQEKRDIRNTEAMLRALGLLADSVDLLDAVNAQAQGSTLAFYDPEAEEIIVRGKGPLDVMHRATLVHELTHVLQDQHFDLEELMDDSDQTSENAVRALVEGDATRVENRYVDSLSKSDRAEHERVAQELGQAAQQDTEDLPAVVQMLFGAPYALGESMVAVLAGVHGERSIDAAFRKPPASELPLIDPFAAADAVRPRKAPAPRLADGERKIGETDSVGALGLLLVLSGRLDPVTALEAAERWGGDTMVEYRSGAVSCVRASFVGRGGNDTAKLAAALSDWAAAGPAGAATATTKSGRVQLTACDPAPAAAPPEDARIRAAVGLVAARNALLAQALEAGAPKRLARCAGERVIEDPVVLAEIDREARGVQPDDAQVAALQEAVLADVQRCVERG